MKSHLIEFTAAPSAQAHWESLKQRINLSAAAWTFLLLALVICAGLSICSQQAEEFYYAVNLEVNYLDMHELNEYGDYLLQQYLAEQPGNARECVILGASYTAGTNNPDPGTRLHTLLEVELQQRAPGPLSWQATNLASNGYDTWSLFYITRLLRLHRPPDLLVVSPDILRQSDRSLHLVLDTGVRRGDLSPDEVLPVVAWNNQLLYISEADFKRTLREYLPGFQAFTFLSTSYPKRDNIARWLKFTLARISGKHVELEPPASRHADGTHKSWQELPESSRLMELRIESGIKLPELTPVVRHNLELLGAELAAIKQQGTRVIVITMPLNPVVPLDPQGVDAELAAWAQSYGLEFHNYWQSGLIPTEDYKDTGHFLEQGQAIMAHEIARLVFPQSEEEKSE